MDSFKLFLESSIDPAVVKVIERVLTQEQICTLYRTYLADSVVGRGINDQRVVNRRDLMSAILWFLHENKKWEVYEQLQGTKSCPKEISDRIYELAKTKCDVPEPKKHDFGFSNVVDASSSLLHPGDREHGHKFHRSDPTQPITQHLSAAHTTRKWEEPEFARSFEDRLERIHYWEQGKNTSYVNHLLNILDPVHSGHRSSVEESYEALKRGIAKLLGTFQLTRYGGEQHEPYYDSQVKEAIKKVNQVISHDVGGLSGPVGLTFPELGSLLGLLAHRKHLDTLKAAPAHWASTGQRFGAMSDDVVKELARHHSINPE